MSVNVYEWVYVCMSVIVYVWVYTWMSICTYECMCVCISICTDESRLPSSRSITKDVCKPMSLGIEPYIHSIYVCMIVNMYECVYVYVHI